MDTSLRKLTLACPRSLETAVLDVLDNMEPPLPGFSLIPAKGRGADIDLMSVSERVQGAGNIVLIQIILSETGIQSVLDTIRKSCGRAHISYWVEPVLDFGRLQ